jgi:alpha-mannosidase
MAHQQTLARLRRRTGKTYWAARIVAQLDFLDRALEAEGRSEGDLEAFADAIHGLETAIREEGALTRDAVLGIESSLSALGPLCKAYRLHCIGHAHIDMNWLWGYHETVMISLDTFRTVLDLLEKYPDFHFSQSQASVYRIVEKYAPDLVNPIRARIAEGRFEVTASQWVEADMNLPSGESLARQLLYTRRYLREIYGAPEDAFRLVFLPDTFGHNANTPEILASAGVRYLYHGRGSSDHHLYRWFSQSGKSIVAYRDPRWYNTEITENVARFMPAYRRDTGLKTALCMYGVGDHGGGPTMRDIERLADMGRWPLFPTIIFSTLGGFFDEVAGQAPELPEVREERNAIFTGCYSSQSRIKMANRRAQEILYEADLLHALAGLRCGDSILQETIRLNLRDAWINTLFGQFHDILPGSGVQLTREHALGLFQETLASGLSAISTLVGKLAGSNGNLFSGPRSPEALWREADLSHGAGVGFGAERFRLPSVGRGAGDTRVFQVFNPLQWERRFVSEIIVWDWRDDAEEIECATVGGDALRHQVLEVGKEPYWDHRFIRLAVDLSVPGFAAAPVLIRRRNADKAAGERETFFPYGIENWLVERRPEPVLENERLRVVFDPLSMAIRSLQVKEMKADVVSDRSAAGVFRLIQEDVDQMTAWFVGRYHEVTDLTRDVRLLSLQADPNALVQWLEYEVPVAPQASGPGSRLAVRVSLAHGASRLRYDVQCDWLEIGQPGSNVPQLGFHLPLAVKSDALRCDIPFGTLERKPAAFDVPGLSFGAVIPVKKGAPVVQVTTDSKQAFRLNEGDLSLTLLRSSLDPDPYPEIGRHRFSFTVSLLPEAAVQDASISVREALEINHPFIVHAVASSETAEDIIRLLDVQADTAVVSAVKLPEPEAWTGSASGGRRMIVRLYEASGNGGSAAITVPGFPVRSARLLDMHERPVRGSPPVNVRQGKACFPVPAHGTVTIAIECDSA